MAADVMFASLSVAGGRARYIKGVDSNEHTTRFAQEIYNANGELVTVHEKFPVNLGHKPL